MSACLFMKNYKDWSVTDLLSERDRLIQWLRENNPSPGNKFEQDCFGGNHTNLGNVLYLINDAQMEYYKRQEDADAMLYLEREGICGQSVVEKIVSAISFGYSRGYMECLHDRNRNSPSA